MKMYDILKKSLKEMQQPLSQGEKNFKGLHNPIDHTNLVPGVTDQEHVFNGATKPQDNNFPNSHKSGEDVKNYDRTMTKGDDDNEVGYDIPVSLKKEEKWIGNAVKHKGALHRELGVPEGEKIPADKMAAAAHAPGKLGKRARLAQTLKKMHKESNMNHSLGDHEELRKYAHEHGGIDRDDMLQAAHHIEHGHYEGLKSKLRKMDTDPRDFVLGHVHKKHWSGLGYTPMREEVELDEDKYTDQSISRLHVMKHKQKMADLEKNSKIHPMKKRGMMMDMKKKLKDLESRRDSVHKEEVEQVDEVITKKTSMGDVIADFVHSKNPKFAGKSKKQRMKQAMAAYYSKQRNEAYEDSDYVSDEVSMVRTELKTICAKAEDMMNNMSQSMHIEPWVQSKIASAKEMISGVHDYMVYGDKDKTSDTAPSYSQSGQMASSYGKFMNRMGEDYVVEKKGDDEEESDRAANKNIINQMRKAPIDGMHKLTFENGKKHLVDPKHVARALEVHANTPVAMGKKEEVQNALAHSHEHFMHVVKHGKPPAVEKKPKVSLGSMRKEDADPTTKGSARGAMNIRVINGRPEFVKASKKEIKVEELIGGQKNLDKNHNGKLDKMDFKLLRSKKKKMAEEVLERLYDTLSEENRVKFGELISSQEGIDTLLAFAEEHGI